MAEETQEQLDFNLDELKPKLEEAGFVVKKKEEEEGFKQSLERMKKEELKNTWDMIDKTIYNLTGIEKNIREDNGLERSVDYYQRALSTVLNEKKTLSKSQEETLNRLKDYESQLEALKSENPESKYEEKFRELKRQVKEVEERAKLEKEEISKKYQNELFMREVNANIDALRPMLKKDVEYIEDIIDSKKRALLSLESKTLEDGKKVFYKDGEPLINEDGSFKSVSDIMKQSLSNLFEEQKIIEGTGKTEQKAKLNVKQFTNSQELDGYLKDKYGSKVGSKEWREERAELKKSSGL